MSLGICEIGSYMPPDRIDSLARAEEFGVEPEFLRDKVGITRVSRKRPEQQTSDLAVEACNALFAKVPDLSGKDIDCLIVCTQTGDYVIPHTSAILHRKLGCRANCAFFDLNLGCSGYPYALSVALAFMEANGLRRGLVVTADPYSQIISEQDKSTALVFGDGATATLLGDGARLTVGPLAFHSDTENLEGLIKHPEEPLFMNGRLIFNFVMRSVLPCVDECLITNRLTRADIDVYLFHQASKFVLDNLRKTLRLSDEKAPFIIGDYGNTVSSALPLLLENYLNDGASRRLLLAGFGVGLSTAATVLTRVS